MDTRHCLPDESYAPASSV